MVIAKTVKFKLPCKCLYISHEQWLFQHSKCFIRNQRKINSEKLNAHANSAQETLLVEESLPRDSEQVLYSLSQQIFIEHLLGTRQ